MISYRIHVDVTQVETADVETDRYGNVKTTGQNRKLTMLDTTVNVAKLSQARLVQEVTDFITRAAGGAE